MADNSSESKFSYPLAGFELDATGLFCPEPVMLLHKKIREMSHGDVLLLSATDPSTVRDIPKFCLYLGHELVREYQESGRYFYLIRKNTG